MSSSSSWYFIVHSTLIHVFINTQKDYCYFYFWNEGTGRRRQETCSTLLCSNQRSQNSNSGLFDSKAQRYTCCIFCSRDQPRVVFGGQNIEHEHKYKYRTLMWSYLQKQILASLTSCVPTKRTNETKAFTSTRRSHLICYGPLIVRGSHWERHFWLHKLHQALQLSLHPSSLVQ